MADLCDGGPLRWRTAIDVSAVRQQVMWENEICDVSQKYVKWYGGIVQNLATITQILAGLCTFNYVHFRAVFHLLIQKKTFRGSFFQDTRYIAVIRPVLEYCSCIWHHIIPQSLSVQIKSIQKRALRIILNGGRDTSTQKYSLTLTFVPYSRDEIYKQKRHLVNPPARLVSLACCHHDL